MKTSLYLCTLLSTALAFVGCKKAAEPEQESASAVNAKVDAKNEADRKTAALAKEEKKKKKKKMLGPFAIASKGDSTVTGEVRLEAIEGGVRVIVSVKDAPPGEHGTHIHQTADCSAPDAKSAGDHFNPTNVEHGFPSGKTHHLGDLGNLMVSEDGSGTLHALIKGATLEPGGERSYLGRALIVHEKKDDGGQPSGNAGNRLGCAELKG